MLIIGIQKISLFLVLSSLCGSDVRTGFQPHSPTHTVTSNLTMGNPCIIESYREVGRTIYTSQGGLSDVTPESTKHRDQLMSVLSFPPPGSRVL